MAIYDLRPEFKEDAQEGQLVEGGNNAYNNCVPTAFLICEGTYLRQQGLPDDPFEPQDVTNYEYGRYYKGGEEFYKSLEFLQSHPDRYPNLPTVTIESPNTTQLIDYLRQGYCVIGVFRCDVNANISTAGPYFHAAPIVATDSDGFHVWNPEHPDPTYYIRLDKWGSYFEGSAAVFRRSVKVSQQPTQGVYVPKPGDSVDATTGGAIAVRTRVGIQLKAGTYHDYTFCEGDAPTNMAESDPISLGAGTYTLTKIYERTGD